jgi:hypothetical protein
VLEFGTIPPLIGTVAVFGVPEHALLPKKL